MKIAGGQDALCRLLELLRLERLDANLFRGASRDTGQGSVFGGQVLGQALSAAAGTVDGRSAHSLHAYFLLPGDTAAPIVYEVERLRDGRSFSNRRVTAIQHGQAIFELSASFQLPQDGVEHQSEMPQVPAPEHLTDKAELMRRAAEHVPESLRPYLLRDRPIEMRPVQPDDPVAPTPRPAHREIWLRAAGALPDDPGLHRAVLAYASDFSLLGTALLPHGLSFLQQEVRAASLDHAMWFHRDFRVDEWLLYVMDSPRAGHARGFARGSFFTRDGALVASVAQEGLIRTGAAQK